jgi:NAD(P)-dependent dehydrogenase (short-subunit alcohol dehydrogenase family)
VYIACRSEDKAKVSISEIEEELQRDATGGSVHWLQLDLSDPRLAKEAATKFLQKEERLDILGKF